jgi:hypothetical protein
MKLRVCGRGGASVMWRYATGVAERVVRGQLQLTFFLQSLWVHGNGSPHTCKARCGGLVFGRRGGEEGRKGWRWR